MSPSDVIAHLADEFFVTEDKDNWYIYNAQAKLVTKQDKKSKPEFYTALIAKWGYEEVDKGATK